MYLNILKNPIVLGLIASALTYLYLWYYNKDKKKDSKSSKNISLIYPLIAFVLVAGVSYIYFNYSSSDTSASASASVSPQIIEQIGTAKPDIEIANPVNNYKFTKDITSESAASFHLLSRGVNVPNNLNVPDVFIDVYE